jgi:hypothetical protein
LERAPEALPSALDGWLRVGGWPLEQPATLSLVATGAAWGQVPGLVGAAADAVGRWSQAMRIRTLVGPDGGEERRLLAVGAARGLDRLAAWVVVDLALPIDRLAVIVEAEDYLDEVEAEDNGVAHATDAIAALLEQCFGAGGPRRVELGRHAVEILAPLLAQAACLEWREDAA